MKKALLQYSCSAFMLFGCGQYASAATMTFEGASPPTVDAPTSYTEDGINILATSPAINADGNLAHFDVNATPSDLLGGSASDHVGVIHTGNSGEQVIFTYNGGSAFDLLSVDITGWISAAADPFGVPNATFTASSGAIYSAINGVIGVIDFSNMVGWSNIISFTLAMPYGTDSHTCGGSGSTYNCTNVAFDDVTLRAASEVPIPAALPLLAAGLGAMGFMGWRRRRKALTN